MRWLGAASRLAAPAFKTVRETRRLTRLLSLLPRVMGTGRQGIAPAAQPDGRDVGVRGPEAHCDVSTGTAARVPYLAARATPVLVASIPQQAVPTSASSLSPGFPRGLRFLGNPTPACHAPDGLLPGRGEAGRGYFVPPSRLPVGVGVSAVRRGPRG